MDAQLQALDKEVSASCEDVLTQEEVRLVNEFLADLRTHWSEIPEVQQNRFLRVIIDRILLEQENDHFNVEILWRTGAEQRLILFRPANSRPRDRWTEEEEQLLRAHYCSATRAQLLALLPTREWKEILRRGHHSGLRRGKPDITGRPNPHWTAAEDQVIRDYDAGRIGYEELLAQLDRPYTGIRRRATDVLGIDPKRKRIVWRFVDSFTENSRLRAAPRAAQAP